MIRVPCDDCPHPELCRIEGECVEAADGPFDLEVEGEDDEEDFE